MVLATGWHPYPLEKLAELGGGRSRTSSPTSRWSAWRRRADPPAARSCARRTARPPKQVAFVQCAGSRDVNHLAYCSGVCCLASLKQAIYVKEQLPEAEVDDLLHRPPHPGPQRGRADQGRSDRGRPPGQGQGRARSKQRGRGTLAAGGGRGDRACCWTHEADLVVLATGMVPNAARMTGLLTGKDDDGFALDDLDDRSPVAGVARRPEDVASSVRDATGAAARAPGRRGKEGVMDKLGVFLCSGCGIGELSTSTPVAAPPREHGASCISRHECLCGPEGVAAIRGGRADNGLDGVMLAACSAAGEEWPSSTPSAARSTVERVSLREQVVWSHPAGDEDTQMLAEDLAPDGRGAAQEHEARRIRWRRRSTTPCWWSAAAWPGSRRHAPRPVSVIPWCWSRRASSWAADWRRSARWCRRNRPTTVARQPRA